MSGTVKQAIDRAEAAANAGDAAQAISIYRQILVKMPKHSKAKKALVRLEKMTGGGGAAKMTQADANHLIGLLNRGDFAVVEAEAEKMSRQFRTEPFVFNILGYAQGMIGKDSQAIASYKWAIKLNPNFVEAYSNYGSFLVRLERLEEAVDVLKRCLTKKADYAEAHHNLAVAYLGLRDFDNAKHHYDRAIEIDPKYHNALNSRGIYHMGRSDYGEALRDFDRAAQLVPNSTLYLANQMSALVGIGRGPEALKIAERLIEMDPNDTEFRLRYGIQLNDAGRVEEAMAAFDAVLKLDPNRAEPLRILSRLQKGAAREATLEHMKTLMADAQTSPEDKVQLGFGLGQALEKDGEFSQSYAYLEEANQTNRKLMPPLPETDAARFAKVIRAAEQGHFTRLSTAASPSDAPIFVVGLMRSGTSLVEQIIASHSTAFGAGELMAATKLSAPLYELGGKAKEKDMAAFCAEYLDVLHHSAGDAARIVDKMPDNFFHIGLLKQAFPNAKFVNTVRDPRDNCFSIYKNYFDTDAHQYAYDQVELAWYANQYKSLMNFWDAQYPDAIYHIKYEALVADQEAQSRKLFEYLNLPWEDQVLEFHKTDRAVRTASVNQVRQKIYKSSVKSWQNYASHLQTLFNGFDEELWADAFVE